MSSPIAHRSAPALLTALTIVLLSLCLGQGCPPPTDPADLPPDVYGDGLAGDLTVSTDALLSAVAPTGNFQFANVTIDAGATLTVPSGTTLRCTGSFINNGTLLVSTGAVSPATADAAADPGISPAGAEAGQLPGSRGGQGLTSEQALTVLDVPITAGGAGGTTAMFSCDHGDLANVTCSPFGGAGGNGGGGLVILAQGPFTNAGTIQADGGDASAGAGGGAGGIIILASRASIDNTGSLLARGGDGGSAVAQASPVFQTKFFCAGGGGGGGLVRLVSPSITTGTVDVSGGTGGNGGETETSASPVAGAGGGACGGNGGTSGRFVGYVPVTSEPGEPGDPGQVISTLADPTALFY